MTTLLGNVEDIFALRMIPSGKLTKSYGKIAIYSEFSLKKMIFHSYVCFLIEGDGHTPINRVFFYIPSDSQYRMDDRSPYTMF